MDRVSVEYPRLLETLGDGTVVVFPISREEKPLLVRDDAVTSLPAPEAEPAVVSGSSARDLWVLGRSGTPTYVDHLGRQGVETRSSRQRAPRIGIPGRGFALAVGRDGQRRYLGRERRVLEVAQTQPLDLALAPFRGGSELWVVGNPGDVEHQKGGVWNTLKLSTSGLRHAVAVSARGDVDIVAHDGGAWHSEGSAPERFSARSSPFGKDWLVAVMHDAGGAAWILSEEGGVARWEGKWQVQRPPERQVGERHVYFSGIARDADGGIWLDGYQHVGQGATAHFLVHRAAKGWVTEFPKEADFDACRAPRHDIAFGAGGQLLGASGTPRRPCLLRRDGDRWSEVPLLTGPAGALTDEAPASRAQELIVLHSGAWSVRRSFLALRRADGWHLERAPLASTHKTALDPASQRAWLIAGIGFLLDFTREEAWRFVTPTLVLGEAAPKVSVRDLVALGAPSVRPEPTAHGDAWTRAMAKGRVATNAEDYPAAIAAFDAALAAEPHDPRALAERGYARLEANEINAADFNLCSARDRTTDPALLGAIQHNLALIAEQRASQEAVGAAHGMGRWGWVGRARQGPGLQFGLLAGMRTHFTPPDLSSLVRAFVNTGSRSCTRWVAWRRNSLSGSSRFRGTCIIDVLSGSIRTPAMCTVRE